MHTAYGAEWQTSIDGSAGALGSDATDGLRDTAGVIDVAQLAERVVLCVGAQEEEGTENKEGAAYRGPLQPGRWKITGARAIEGPDDCASETSR